MRWRQLEASILSSKRRGLKLVLTWALLVGLCVPYGLAGSALVQPSLLSFLRDPPAHDGAPVSFAFTWVRPSPFSDGAQVMTAAGWLPLISGEVGVPTLHAVSLAGRFRSPGALQVERVLVHPRRGAKVWVSLVALVGLSLAVAFEALSALRVSRRVGTPFR